MSPKSGNRFSEKVMLKLKCQRYGSIEARRTIFVVGGGDDTDRRGGDLR
jgi:hypothetical protein